MQNIKNLKPLPKPSNLHDTIKRLQMKIADLKIDYGNKINEINNLTMQLDSYKDRVCNKCEGLFEAGTLKQSICPNCARDMAESKPRDPRDY
jgi:hypothetical protein